MELFVSQGRIQVETILLVVAQIWNETTEGGALSPHVGPRECPSGGYGRSSRKCLSFYVLRHPKIDSSWPVCNKKIKQNADIRTFYCYF